MRSLSTAPQVQRAAFFGPLMLLTLGMALAWYFAINVAVERYREVLFGLAALQSVWIAVRWRASVYVFCAYVVFEGFIVNYFHTFPELNLVKDLMAVALFGSIALRVALRREPLLPSRPWVVTFFGFSALYLVQIFNPALPNLLVGLVGVRATLMFFVLAPVAYWLFDTRERVIQFAEFLVFLSVPASLFGILQAYLGPAWVMTLSPGFERAVFYAFGAGGRMENAYFRTFSTFVQTGSFSSFLWLTLLLTVALWVLPKWKRRRPLLTLILVVQFAAFLTTGGRSPFLLLTLSVCILLLTDSAARRTVPLVLLMPAILWGSSFVFGTAAQERYETILDFEFVVQRNAPLMTGWLSQAMETEWTGLGAGYASVASRHVGATPLNQNVVENALAKVRFEAGLPGLLLYIMFIFCVFWECIVAPQKVRDPMLRWVVTAFATFVGLSTSLVFAGTPFEVSPTNTYLWFFLGLMARAPSLLEPSEQDAR